MTPGPASADDYQPTAPSSQIKPDIPNVARTYNYFLGGKDNFAADREAAEKVLEVFPEARRVARDNRGFLQRAVRTAVIELGITQFIDLGAGLPTSDNTHQVARRADPEARVVYIDNDPIVLAHGRALLADADMTTVIQADLRSPTQVLAHPDLQRMIDFTRPVGLLGVAVFHFVTEQDDPIGIVTGYSQALPSGSALVLSHVTSDNTPQDKIARVVRIYSTASAPLNFRTAEQITGLFQGFPLLDPGLGPVQDWRPEGQEPPPAEVTMLGALAVKP